MIDPFTAAATLRTLIGSGLGVWKAYEKHGSGEDDLKAVQSLIDAGLGIAGLNKDASGKRIAALHFVLVTRAFGEAFNRHWYGDKHFAPGTGRWEWLKQDKTGRARMEQIEQRLRIAAPKLKEAGGLQAHQDVKVIDALIGDPVSTPYYRQLWGAFADEGLMKAGEEPLIMPGRRLAFERQFRLAYAEGLTTGLGEEIRRYLMALREDRARLVRELLMRDMAGWGARHVFGNVAEHADLAPMPLEGMYVEPYAGSESLKIEDEPVLGLLERLFVDNPVVVLQADFGHGKSLTARMIAWQKAQAYLSEGKTSPELWRPVFVKCAEDFESHGDELEKIIKRALWRQADGMKLELPIGDKAFEMADPQARTLFLIDGLDEVALADQEVKSFFLRMRQQAGGCWRFIVFTRPAALRHGDHLKDVPVLDLRSLRIDKSVNQVNDWLSRWSSFTDRPTKLTAVDLEERNLLKIAVTPILLFMIAHTWDEHLSKKPTRGDVYESFFQVMARGKYEKGGDQHAVIVESSNELRDRLQEMKHISENAPAAEAMLWLMSRVAWKAKCLEDAEWLEGKKRALAGHHIQRILSDELELEGSTKIEKTIQIGLLLALQANLEEGTPRILFGHKSFREFLVGRYWASELRRHTEEESRDWEMVGNEPLLQGRLLGQDDQSFYFLLNALARWDGLERAQLSRWAQQCFDDERISNGAKGLRDDRRPLLREAALAIGSSISVGMKAKDQRTLLSLNAWFWFQGSEQMLIAPNFRSPFALLHRTIFSPGSSLTGADMSGADLTQADMVGVDLSGADLRGANLTKANLSRANLRGAYMQNAELLAVDLYAADLTGADLTGANLTGAELTGATLTGATLTDTRLLNANFDDAFT